MKLYNSYCYSDLYQVAESIQSTVFIGNGLTVSSTSVSGSSVIINYFTPIGGAFGSSLSGSFSVTPPDCFIAGFNNSFSGVTTDDAVIYGSFVLAAFVSAYIFKLLKRAL